MAEPIVIFLQIIFGLLVLTLAGIVFITIYQITNPNMKKHNRGLLHTRRNKDEN